MIIQVNIPDKMFMELKSWVLCEAVKLEADYLQDGPVYRLVFTNNFVKTAAAEYWVETQTKAGKTE